MATSNVDHFAHAREAFESANSRALEPTAAIGVHRRAFDAALLAAGNALIAMHYEITRQHNVAAGREARAKAKAEDERKAKHEAHMRKIERAVAAEAERQALLQEAKSLAKGSSK